MTTPRLTLALRDGPFFDEETGELQTCAWRLAICK